MLSDRSCTRGLGGAYAALNRIPLFDGASRREFRIERLSNSLTNSSYRVRLNGNSFLLRVSGDGTSDYIDRAAERHNAKIAARFGVNAEVLFSNPADGTMLCRFIEGVGMDPELFASDSTAPVRAALSLRRVHGCGKLFMSRFDPFERIEAYLRLLQSAKQSLPDDLGEVLEEAGRARRKLTAASAALSPCHNDPWPGNFVDAMGRMYLVDWEYSGMNDPMWDIADLSVESALDSSQDRKMLEAYFGGAAPPGMRFRFEAYKPVSDLLWALWGFLQDANGKSEEDFLAYALVRYERCKIRFDEPI